MLWKNQQNHWTLHIMPKSKSKLTTELLNLGKYRGMKMLFFVRFVSEFSMGDGGKANIKTSKHKKWEQLQAGSSSVSTFFGSMERCSKPCR